MDSSNLIALPAVRQYILPRRPDYMLRKLSEKKMACKDPTGSTTPSDFDDEYKRNPIAPSFPIKHMLLPKHIWSLGPLDWSVMRQSSNGRLLWRTWIRPGRRGMLLNRSLEEDVWTAIVERDRALAVEQTLTLKNRELKTELEEALDEQDNAGLQMKEAEIGLYYAFETVA
uniref:Uncharacterized protein n=1 Tax=Cannabis sativa TaxID=3483 RepID=A0A803PDJ0_CANSA